MSPHISCGQVSQEQKKAEVRGEERQIGYFADHFLRSPRLLEGALVGIDPFNPLTSVVVS